MEEYYTPEELSQKFKVKKRTIYFWVREGRLKAVRLGSLIRIPKAAWEEFVKNTAGSEQNDQE